MKKRFITHLIAACCYIAASTAAEITGIVTDRNDGKRIGYATIGLEPAGSKAQGKAAISSDEGTFAFKQVAPGRYTLTASLLGYEDAVMEITVNGDNDNRRHVEIKMTPTANTLDEVNVIGQKSQMRLEIDRKVFDVEQDIASKGGTAAEALQNIPSVSVDIEGNISLRNNSNVDLWINGKPSGLTGNNRAQYLEQLPAESIKSIEVITNPSSKYSAEGVAGAINIILKDGGLKGQYGSISVSANTYGGVMPYGNYTLNADKVDFTLMGGMQYSNNFDFTNDYTLTSWEGKDTTTIRQYNKSNYGGLGGMLRAGLTYRITDKDQIQFTTTGILFSQKGNTTLETSDETGNIFRNRTENNDPSRFGMFSANADYNRMFAKGHTLRIFAEFNMNKHRSHTDYEQTSYGIYTLQKERLAANARAGTFQLDYSNQITEAVKIESGLSSKFGKCDYNIFTTSGTGPADLIPDPQLNNDYDYSRGIHALYFTVSGKIKNFGIQAGLRGEYMMNDISSKAPNVQTPNARTDLWHLFPSLFLSYKLPKENEIQLNYTHRVNYPRDNQLDPYRQIIDSTAISYGNPALTSEYSHQVEMNYIKNWDKHVLSASLYYRYTYDVIQQVGYYDAPSMYYTYRNISDRQDIGVELVAKNKLWKILDLTTTVNIYYNKLSPYTFVYTDSDGNEGSTAYDGSSNFTWTLRINASLALPKNFIIQGNGEYNAKQIMLQGEALPSYAMDLGIKKSFLDKRLVVSISGRNLLNSRSYTTETYGDNFYQHKKMKYSRWMLRFTLSYKFGKTGTNNTDAIPEDFNIGM